MQPQAEMLSKSPLLIKKKAKETRGRPRLQKNIDKENLGSKLSKLQPTEQNPEDSETWEGDSQDQGKCKKRN